MPGGLATPSGTSADVPPEDDLDAPPWAPGDCASADSTSLSDVEPLVFPPGCGLGRAPARRAGEEGVRDRRGKEAGRRQEGSRAEPTAALGKPSVPGPGARRERDDQLSLHGRATANQHLT